MKNPHSIEQILQYVNSLPEEKQELLRKMDDLNQYRIWDDSTYTTYHFPNGYGFTYWHNSMNQSFNSIVFTTGDEDSIETQMEHSLQTQCWIAAWEVMARNSYLPNESEKIILAIRRKCKNPDDLAKIAEAIEAMREELIEESAACFKRHTHA
jgi:hypothetical protein